MVWVNTSNTTTLTGLVCMAIRAGKCTQSIDARAYEDTASAVLPVLDAGAASSSAGGRGRENRHFVKGAADAVLQSVRTMKPASSPVLFDISNSVRNIE